MREEPGAAGELRGSGLRGPLLLRAGGCGDGERGWKGVRVTRWIGRVFYVGRCTKKTTAAGVMGIPPPPE